MPSIQWLAAPTSGHLGTTILIIRLLSWRTSYRTNVGGVVVDNRGENRGPEQADSCVTSGKCADAVGDVGLAARARRGFRLRILAYRCGFANMDRLRGEHFLLHRDFDNRRIPGEHLLSDPHLRHERLEQVSTRGKSRVVPRRRHFHDNTDGDRFRRSAGCPVSRPLRQTCPHCVPDSYDP